MWACACVRCTHLCGVRGRHQDSSCHASSCFRVSHCPWSSCSARMAGQQSPLLLPSSARPRCTWMALCGLWGSKSRTSCLHSKHFAHRGKGILLPQPPECQGCKCLCILGDLVALSCLCSTQLYDFLTAESHHTVSSFSLPLRYLLWVIPDTQKHKNKKYSYTYYYSKKILKGCYLFIWDKVSCIPG